MLSENEQLDPRTVNSLLTLDERLRSGRFTDTTHPSLTDVEDAALRTGMDALLELEAAIPRSSHSMPSWAPRNIGRFELRSVLGAGGFAVVYLAHDPQLHRLVALKVPRPHAMIQRKLRQRFVNEARAAARLDHPGIVQVFEAGEDGDLPYIACALCEGPTLADWLASRKGPLDPQLAAEVVRQLADGLQYSHERGILHRDLKPGNVLLFPTDQVTATEFPYHARISDFGLAKLLDDPQLDSVTSQLLGTPRFMAPELLGGAPCTPSVAADVYALGAILYAMLTGQAPFGSASLAETMRCITTEDPVPPELINRSVGKDLSFICLKCLEKSPASRYASAAELRDDLHRYLTGQCVRARQTPLLVRTRKWCRRHPLGAALALVSTMFVLILGVMTFRYTDSLRGLQDKLLDTNAQLRDRVRELHDAVLLAQTSQQQAAQERTHARRLLQIADTNLAGRMWHQRDTKGAEALLRPWVNETSLAPGSRSPADVALSYLWRRITVASRTLRQSSQAVWWMHADSPSEKLLLAGSAGRIELADLQDTAAGLRETADGVQGTSGELSCITLSDDRALAATAGDDGKVRIWRLDVSGGLTSASFTLAHELQVVADASVYGVLFLPGTHHLVICARTPTLTIRDGDSGMLLREVVTAHPRFIESMVISPDGTQLATAGADGHVEVFRLPELTSRGLIPASERAIAMVAFSRDGNQIVCGGGDRLVRLYAVEGGLPIAQYQTFAGISSVVCNSLNEVLVGDRDGALTMFRIPAETTPPETGEPVPQWRPDRRWAGHDVPVASICWAADASAPLPTGAWVSADRNGVVKAWRVGAAPSTTGRLAEASPTTDIPVILPYRNVWLRGAARGIEILEPPSITAKHSLPTSAQITSLAEADASGLILAGDAAGTLYWIQETPAGLQITDQVSVLPGAPIVRLFPSLDGQLLCAIDNQWRLAVVDLASKVIRRSFDRSRVAVTLPDGQHLIRSLVDVNELQVVRISDGQVRATLTGHQSTISRIAFTPNGQTCLTASHDRTVCLWDVATWTQRQQLTGHASPVIALSLAPGGDLFATGDETGVMRLWDVASGRELTELDERLPALLDLKFSADGSTLIGWDVAQKFLSLSL